MSKGATTATVVIGCVLLVLAGFSIWFQRSIADEDRYVERTSAALDSADVHEDLAEAITDDLLSGVPLLRPLSSTLERALQAALGTPAFNLVYEQIARQVHQVMMSSDDLSVRIDSPMLAALAQAALSGLQGTPLGDFLSSVITSGSGLTEITLIDSDDLPPVDAIDPLTQWLAILGGIGGALLLIVAVVLTRDRPAALSVAGISLALGGLVVLLLTYALRGWATQRSDTDLGRAIAEVSYDAVITSLRVQNIITIVIGLGLALGPLVYRSARTKTSAPAAA